MKTRLTGRGDLTERPGSGAPTDERLADGQHADHWVLSEEERAKGFVRPVRRSYRHVGSRPRFPLRELTADEQERHAGRGYVKFEAYPEGESAALGRFWTQDQLHSGCGVVTTMPVAIAETYARQPDFYGSTFCSGCGQYLPVGANGEFVWEGTDSRVGT